MKSTVEIINYLDHILDAQLSERTNLVEELQNEVWSDESIEDEK